MNVDPQRIEHLIGLIASGQLDPQQAARELLLTSPPRKRAAAEQETVESLIQRLGMPPPVIQQDWQRQIEALAQSWQQAHGRPLPHVRLSDLVIDDHNQLAFASGLFSQSPLRSAAERPGTVAEGRMPLKIDQASLSNQPRADESVPQPEMRRRQNRRIALALMLAAGAALAAYGGYQYRTTPADPAPLIASSHRGGEQATSPSPRSRSPLPRDQASRSAERSAASLAELRRRRDLGLDNPLLTGGLRDADHASGGDDTAGLDALQGDDLQGDLRGGLPRLADDRSEAAPLDPDHSSESSALLQAGDGDVDMRADPSDSSPEIEISERPTFSAAPAEAVALPPLSTSGEPSLPELLFASSVTDLRLEFPTPTTIALERHAAGTWALIDTADATELASLESDAEGLRFLWTTAAASKASARQVAAGRLVLSTPAGQQLTLWLRPRLRSEPLRIDFVAAQSAAAWSLQGPPIQSAGELHVEVNAAPSIEQIWIEPVDPHNLRRNVSILQWTPRGASAPAIRCRMELRAAARLSAKLRFAVQLDEGGPWQPFSASQLVGARDQVSLALNRMLLEQSEMTRQYSAATTAARRLLKPRKDALDQNVAVLQTLLQRLQQLDALQGTIASSAELRIKLAAHWPDAEQIMLEMTLPSAPSPEPQASATNQPIRR